MYSTGPTMPSYMRGAIGVQNIGASQITCTDFTTYMERQPSVLPRDWGTKNDMGLLPIRSTRLVAICSALSCFCCRPLRAHQADPVTSSVALSDHLHCTDSRPNARADRTR